MSGKTTSLLLFAVIFLSTTNVFSESVERFANKIVYLQKNDIWIVDQDGGKKQQITNTDGKVGGFLFSPNLGYPAYYNRIKYVNDVGIYENKKPPKVPVYSIVIVDMNSQQIKREIKPPASGSDPWIRIKKWLSDGKLIFSSSDGFAEGWGFEYDVIKNRVAKYEGSEPYELPENYKAIEAIEELLDQKAISPRHRSKACISPSFNKQSVVWFEFDRNVYALRLYNFKEQKAKVIYELNWPNAGDLAWSPDDKYICIFDRRYEREIVVLEVENTGNSHRIRGKNVQWISNGEIIFVHGNDVYLFNAETKTGKLLVENAAQPVFLQMKRKYSQNN